MKPICVMYFPEDFSFHESGLKLNMVEFMNQLNFFDYGNNRYSDDDKEMFGGYLYWCFIKQGITEPELQVFHPKNFTKANYTELKELLINKLKELSNDPAHIR